MGRCPRCSSELAGSARFCSSCGEPISSVSVVPTLAREVSPSNVPPAADVLNLVPGSSLLGRYRILGVLGRGGMGVVYRADDLKLGQTVALKFLPPALARDKGYMERFLGEVRAARQVSHPNVCRVHDLGEADGHYFLSMEYVDGEDLATLLARIGRLPPAKALEIAHELCGGLAAAHARQLVHRDLKPANIMVDGRGHARITDFGLAIRPGDARAGEVAGTPAYMAPELFAGEPATVRSDLYALGIVLYELYTGKHPWDRRPASDAGRKDAAATPDSPSQHVPEIDPGAERIILRCLAADPAARPSSVLQVAAALPGGNPLALAIAAGETPSPEMVAAAGEAGGLAPRVAWSLLAGVVLSIGLLGFAARYGALVNLVPVKEPALLIERSRELASSLGYGDAVDSAYWYDVDDAYFVHAAKAPAPERHRGLASASPSPLRFWYRQGPRPLESVSESFQVDRTHPPLFYSGEIEVGLDSTGRLGYLAVIGPQTGSSAESDGPPDWQPLFTAAGLNLAQAREVPAAWLPDVPADRTFSWEAAGDAPGARVAGASYHGRVVFFRVLAAWSQPTRLTAAQRFAAERVALAVFVGSVIVIFAICVLFARRNIRLGRGDRRGAVRAGVAVFASTLVGLTLGAHYCVSAGWIWYFFNVSLGLSFGLAMQFGVFYMALEPYVRRAWPEILVSWSRLLAGAWRDPLVGRDVLVGILFGVAARAFSFVRTALPYWFPVAGVAPSASGVGPFLASVPAFLGDICGAVTGAMAAIGALAALFVTARITGRKAAGVVFILSVLTLANLRGANLLIEVPVAALFSIGMTACLLRFGLLTSIVAWIVVSMSNVPLTLDITRFYAWRGLFVVGLLIALAIYGFRVALAGRPAFGSVFEE